MCLFCEVDPELVPFNWVRTFHKFGPHHRFSIIVTTNFLNINGSMRCINVFVLMLTGFCSSVFIFVVTVIAIVFVAGVDLDPNRKMSPTFPNPHVI